MNICINSKPKAYHLDVQPDYEYLSREFVNVMQVGTHKQAGNMDSVLNYTRHTKKQSQRDPD